jgi:hypothetical protein
MNAPTVNTTTYEYVDASTLPNQQRIDDDSSVRTETVNFLPPRYLSSWLSVTIQLLELLPLW